MVCDRVSQKSFVQIVFFFGYMVGSLIFGILSDKLVLVKKFNRKYSRSFFVDLVDDQLWVFHLLLLPWLVLCVHLPLKDDLDSRLVMLFLYWDDFYFRVHHVGLL